MERCAICDFVVDPDEAHVHVRCHANAVSVLADKIEKLELEIKKAQIEAAVWKKKAGQYLQRAEIAEMPEGNPYQEVFDFYNTLGLIKHRKLTKEMRAAIDVARRRGEYSWDELRMLLDRHAKVVRMTANNGPYAVPARSLAEFFGQKVAGSTVLICSEYANGGAKWRRYKDGNPSTKADSRQRSAFERPVGNLDHLALDPFADEK